jgi:O-succinylbenzoic acid--CoA ligase
VLPRRFDAAAVRAGLEAGDYALASLVATQLRRLRDAGLEHTTALRALVLGGAPVPPDLVEWAREHEIPVQSTYGMTETTSQVAVTAPWVDRAAALPGAQIQIASDGEIVVRGPMVAPGALDSDGWLHTGDLGEIGRDDLLRVKGRLRDLIITGGENVPPAVVEAALLAHPSVADAAVSGVPDPEWGERVVAYVVERRPVSDYELLAFSRERLAGYQVPKEIVRVAGLPRNAGGKLLRARLGDAVV